MLFADSGSNDVVNVVLGRHLSLAESEAYRNGRTVTRIAGQP